MGIAILGCGEIANIAHLPAYRDMGLRVNACYDVSLDAARSTAEKFSIPCVCNTLDDVLSRDDVQIVDIAFHVNGRIDAVRKASAAGKHILIQKPVAHTVADAKEMADMARHAGVKLQVNQQARWVPVFVLAKKWLDMGAIGRLNFMRHEMRGWQDDPKTWYPRQPNMTLVDHGIHYFDLLRLYAGRDAKRVAAVHACVPGQHHISPVIYSAIIDFGYELTASHCFNNKVETKEPWSLNITLDGEEGSIFCDFETARLSRKDGTEIEVKPERKWFPDAFAGPMADLMDAITDNREPACSGASNLGTMKLVLGALQSAEEGRFVELQ